MALPEPDLKNTEWDAAMKPASTHILPAHSHETIYHVMPREKRCGALDSCFISRAYHNFSLWYHQFIKAKLSAARVLLILTHSSVIFRLLHTFFNGCSSFQLVFANLHRYFVCDVYLVLHTFFPVHIPFVTFTYVFTYTFC